MNCTQSPWSSTRAFFVDPAIVPNDCATLRLYRDTIRGNKPVESTARMSHLLSAKMPLRPCLYNIPPCDIHAKLVNITSRFEKTVKQHRTTFCDRGYQKPYAQLRSDMSPVPSIHVRMASSGPVVRFCRDVRHLPICHELDGFWVIGADRQGGQPNGTGREMYSQSRCANSCR